MIVVEQHIGVRLCCFGVIVEEHTHPGECDGTHGIVRFTITVAETYILPVLRPYMLYHFAAAPMISREMVRFFNGVARSEV